MPGSKTHKIVGAGAGAAFAAFEAKGQSNEHFWIEVIGGSFGGYTSGTLPDWLEPAISGWHRGPYHSVGAGTAVAYSRPILAQLAQTCRLNADRARLAQVEDVQTGTWMPIKQHALDQLISQLKELFWRLLAGFLNGLAAGYVSHLVLDAGTPRGIPLLAGKSSLKL
jgi:hypothetical protein